MTPFGVSKRVLLVAIVVALFSAAWELGRWLGTKPERRPVLPGAQTWRDR